MLLNLCTIRLTDLTLHFLDNTYISSNDKNNIPGREDTGVRKGSKSHGYSQQH